MSDQQQFKQTFSLVLLEKISIQNAIKLALNEDCQEQFYATHRKQLPEQIYLIQISLQNQQWILVKTDKQCKQLLQRLLQKQSSPHRIVKRIQDAFLNIIPFSKNNNFSNDLHIIEQLEQLNYKKDILQNKIFSDFISYNHVFERYIYRKFTMVKKNGGRFKETCCKIGSIFSQWKKREVNVQYNGITYKNEFGETKEYLPFSHGFEYFYGKAQTDSKLGIVLISNHRRLILEAQSADDFILFLYLVKKKTIESPYININRFNSFAPIRNNTHSEFYIDGKEYFEAVSSSLKKAKQSIFITGWMLSPEFLIERGENNTVSLFDVISDRVQQGVKVNIMIYHESSFLANDSEYTKYKFQSLGPKVKVLRHPTGKLPVLWSHHSKMVIIDKKQVFFGGLDLCYGRYDNNNHNICLQKLTSDQMYPGIEYNNCRIKDIDNVRNYTIDHIDRRLPRLPWHDICQSATGSIVSDFFHHFVQIWNFASYENREVLNKELLNAPSENEFKTIHNIISSKSSQMDIANDYKIKYKKKNKILNALTNKIQEVRTKSQQSIIVWKSKLYPEKKKKLEELYRKSKSPTDINQFEGYIATLKKQLDLQQQNSANTNGICRENTTEEQKENIKRRSHPHVQIEKINKNSIFRRSIFCDKPQIFINNNMNIQLKISNEFNNNINNNKKNIKNNNINENYIQFLKNLQIKANEIKCEIDEDIDSQEQAPAKIWQNKPYQPDLLNQGTDQCQLLRSVGNWSIGCSAEKTQFSIHLAYLQLISQAKHFIYIQNQFFISSTHLTVSVKNQICNALFRRVKNAVINNEKFKIYVMLPLLPAFAGDLQKDDCTMLRMIMNWHYLSIKGLLQNIEQLKVDPHDYIQFLGLRTYGMNNQKIPQTQIIYVHSKLMIIDDRVVICGSANINDRSLLGNRDSQIAVATYGQDEVHGFMAGLAVLVSQKVKKFRMRLWKEHFQLDDKMLDDPISHNLWDRVKYISQNNTKIYRRLFGCYPDNEMKTLSDLKSIKQKAVINCYISQTNQLHGNTVEYPYRFLQNQQIQSSLVSKQYYIPTQCLV